MILIDTNILIAAIRASDPGKLIATIRNYNGAVCGVVRAELLHGARSDAERIEALTILNALAYLPTPESLWDEVGNNLRALRNHGVTVPFPDAVLATIALFNGVELWSRDSHFVHVQRVLPTLRLFVEPP